MNTKIVKIGAGPECEFWRIGDDVYRCPKFCELDTEGKPMGRRWECSYRQFVHYRAVFEASGLTLDNPMGGLSWDTVNS